MKKTDKKTAHYVDRYKGPRPCRICKHFRPPNGCAKVEGRISPDGHSKFWAKKE